MLTHLQPQTPKHGKHGNSKKHRKTQGFLMVRGGGVFGGRGGGPSLLTAMPRPAPGPWPDGAKPPGGCWWLLVAAGAAGAAGAAAAGAAAAAAAAAACCLLCSCTVSNTAATPKIEPLPAANLHGSALVALARVPVCPWIGVVPGCPCAHVPVDWAVPGCPCARASDKVQKSRSDTLAGSCSLSVDSPKSPSTLRGSYGRCKGRCLIWVLLTLVCQHRSSSSTSSSSTSTSSYSTQHQHHHFPLP